MNPKLILIEGLPGSGKTTIAELVYQLLKELGVNAQLFLEGNLDHPADYDGVAYYGQNEYEMFLSKHADWPQMFQDQVVSREEI